MSFDMSQDLTHEIVSSPPSESNSASTGSTSVSEFVRKRFNGEVKVFGGDIRNGLHDVVEAVGGSVNAFQVTSALQNLMSALRPIEPALSMPRESPIGMIDKTAVVEHDFKAAAELDDVRLRLLLDASTLAPEHVQAYYTLLQSARRSVQRREQAIELSALRKSAGLEGPADESSAVLFDTYSRARVDEFYANYKLLESDLKPSLVARALTHESVVGGRGTNRKLAMLGDFVLKVFLVEPHVLAEQTPGQLSDTLTTTQTNLAMRDKGVAAGLDQWVRVGPNIDPASRKIMATFVEALYGAAYISNGMSGVKAVNAVFQIVDQSD